MTEFNEPPKYDYPRWVRWLAVAYWMSRLVMPVAFFVFMAAMSAAYIRRGGFDEVVIALGAAGLACPALGAAFRGWFVWWGRRNYPEPDEPAGG